MTTDNLQPYAGFNSHGGAYHSDDVRRILADAHAHYEAQLRPLSGLARPDADTTAQMLDALRFVVQFHDQLTPGDIERLRSIIGMATGGAS